MSRFGPKQALHLALVGIGGVGSEFLRQITVSPHPVSIAAISNSRKMLLFTDGTTCFKPTPGTIALDDPDAQPASLDRLFGALSGLVQRKLGRVVFVDNTASEAVAETYPRFLDAGIHVVTPNKKAFSGSIKLYKRIIGVTCPTTGRGLFFNEATVGAGLPIISTLKDLVQTGDEVGLTDPVSVRVTNLCRLKKSRASFRARSAIYSTHTPRATRAAHPFRPLCKSPRRTGTR